MARKHFEEYYDKIKKQYFQLVETIEETTKVVTEKAIDPQVIENLTEMLKPIKDSYMGLAYVEYLLNLPKNEKVKKRNERQFQTLLNRIDKSKHEETVIAENKKVMNKINSVVDEEFR